eukprot:2135415-Rhodomonas_salina.1
MNPLPPPAMRYLGSCFTAAGGHATPKCAESKLSKRTTLRAQRAHWKATRGCGHPRVPPTLKPQASSLKPK